MTELEAECVVFWEWIQPPTDMPHSSCYDEYLDVLYESESSYRNFHDECGCNRDCD